jgi:phosphoribosylaminoimidazole (AIR) synthetase
MCVLNFHPYQIKLLFKDLMKSLSLDQPMTTDIFNMGMRIVAHKNNQKAKLVQEKTSHYMELDFNESI